MTVPTQDVNRHKSDEISHNPVIPKVRAARDPSPQEFPHFAFSLPQTLSSKFIRVSCRARSSSALSISPFHPRDRLIRRKTKHTRDHVRDSYYRAQRRDLWSTRGVQGGRGLQGDSTRLFTNDVARYVIRLTFLLGLRRQPALLGAFFYCKAENFADVTRLPRSRSESLWPRRVVTCTFGSALMVPDLTFRSLSVLIPTRNKRSAGFAFVHFKTEDAAKKAVAELNENGQPKTCQECHD